MELIDQNFLGIDANGNEITFNLKNYSNKTFVLYFYPKDLTSGCTKEACSFRDQLDRITSYAEIIGVSPDLPNRHLKFREQHQLNFSLISDPEHTLAQSFGVWQEKSMYGRKYMGIVRSTFVIKNGEIIKEWRKVKVNGHVDQVIEFLQNS